MPSFFFHIAVDLHKFSKDSNPDLQSKEKHLESFKTITSLQPDKSAFKKKAGGQDLSHYRGSPQVFSKETDCFDNIGPATLAVTESGKRKDSSNPTSLTDDWRYGKISVHAIDMAYSASGGKECSKTEITSHITDSITTGPGGFATKGRYEPSHAKDEDLGWGIVRLYRDNEETPGLYDDAIVTKGSKGGRGLVNQRERNELPFRDEDCTTLCILAVPSYITPSDFLGFVGEKTRDEVSHFRMIRTERSNRYMVLMKFRNGKKAREWRKEWNGKAFDAMEVSFFLGCYQHVVV